MARKDELNTIIRKAHDEMREIETAERLLHNDGLVGKCYKYRNCFSCPEAESDYWWLYVRVDKLSESGTPVTFGFQTDKYGTVSIEADKHNFTIGDDWAQISEKEFTREWNKLKKNLSVKFGD